MLCILLLMINHVTALSNNLIPIREWKQIFCSEVKVEFKKGLKTKTECGRLSKGFAGELPSLLYSWHLLQTWIVQMLCEFDNKKKQNPSLISVQDGMLENEHEHVSVWDEDGPELHASNSYVLSALLCLFGRLSGRLWYWGGMVTDLENMCVYPVVYSTVRVVSCQQPW